MALEFLPGRYCSQVWFVDMPGIPCNLLGALFKDEHHWTYTYRFRYDGPDDPPGGRKNWFECHVDPKASEATVLGSIRKSIAKIMYREAGASVHELPVRSSDPKYIAEQIVAQPWAQVGQIGQIDDTSTNRELN
jgi:hypothetical protein